MEPQKNSNKTLIIKIIAGIVVLGAAGFGFAKLAEKPALELAPNNEDTSATTTSSTSTSTSVTPTGETPVAATDNKNKYKNGTYTATGMYTSPAGREEVVITLVIKDDVVVGGTFVGKASNPSSVKNQGLFKEGFNQYVVGKNIDSIGLQVVNGSSLTPKGFMDALAKIKVQAQA
jgi:hypothetical protein